MGAKPKKTGSAAKVPAKKKRVPARRVPARRAATKSGRAARDQTVEAYVAGLDAELAGAARRLRDLVLSAAPSATESIKWGQPVYEDNGPFCYFKADAHHITFGFWRGTELDDRDGRLEDDGERMKHIKIHGADDVDDEVLSDWVRQAVDLNRQHGNPTRQTGGSPSQWEARSGADEEGEYGEGVQEIEPAQIESVQSIETVVDPGSDRFQDDDPFGSSWKDSER